MADMRNRGGRVPTQYTISITIFVLRSVKEVSTLGTLSAAKGLLLFNMGNWLNWLPLDTSHSIKGRDDVFVCLFFTLL